MYGPVYGHWYCAPVPGMRFALRPTVSDLTSWLFGNCATYFDLPFTESPTGGGFSSVSEFDKRVDSSLLVLSIGISSV